METHKNRYQHGNIHRSCDTSPMKFNYGSTVQPLSVRMCGHRAQLKQFQSGGCTPGTIFVFFFGGGEFGVENDKI